jgi:hypothetical protein
MGKIKFIKSPIGLGIAHRVGETSVSLPDDLKKLCVDKGVAEWVPEEALKRTPPEVVAPKVTPKENTAVRKTGLTSKTGPGVKNK